MKRPAGTCSPAAVNSRANEAMIKQNSRIGTVSNESEEDANSVRIAYCGDSSKTRAIGLYSPVGHKAVDIVEIPVIGREVDGLQLAASVAKQNMIPVKKNTIQT